MVDGMASEAELTRDLDTDTSSLPAVSPRPSRNVRLPKMKMFKSLSKKMSAKTKSDPSVLPSPPVASEEVVEDSDPKTTRARFQEPSTDCEDSVKEMTAGHSRSHQRSQHSGEVFTTTFVNPFRIKPRKPKTTAGTLF